MNAAKEDNISYSGNVSPLIFFVWICDSLLNGPNF